MEPGARPGQPTVLIAGASRGLGLAMTVEFLRRGWRVIATARPGRQASLDALDGAGGLLVVEQLDVTDLAGTQALRRRLEGKPLDILFVNAGVINRDVDAALTDVPNAEYAEMMLTNALGPVRVLECLHDLVPQGGVIGAMSSGLGSLSGNSNGTWPAYASSKAALNMLLKNFATRHGEERAVVAVTPGWVRTEMGGADADLAIEESVPRVVDVLTGAAGRRGLHYLNFNGASLTW